MHGIDNIDFNELINVFLKFRAVKEVMIYNLVDGDVPKSGTLDLALLGKKVNQSIVAKLGEMIEELGLPYTIEFCVFAELTDKDKVAKIKKHGKSLFRR